jgi:hypothetical protein
MMRAEKSTGDAGQGQHGGVDVGQPWEPYGTWDGNRSWNRCMEFLLLGSLHS